MGKTILVTGGSGSLGTALTKHLLNQGCKVRTCSRNELTRQKLIEAIPKEQHVNLSPFVRDVRDLDGLRRAMKGVDTVIHAAALKRVDTCAYDPDEAVKTNIIGTQNVIAAALECNVKKAVLISSDKARAPHNLYGATKLCAEHLWVAANRYCGGDPGKFVALAYGNVFFSNGSVIHNFIKQAQYGVLQITDPQMTRFHITMPQAVDFVLRVAEEGTPGSFWIPKLPSYRLEDLAKAFMDLYQLTREPMIIGKHPGEKQHEELITKTESCTVKTETGTHYILTPDKVHQAGGWAYTSGTSHWRLSIQELKQVIGETIGYAEKGPMVQE